MQCLERFLCLTIPVVVIGAALSADAPTPLAEEDEPGVVDYYLDEGQRVKLTILRDRIGLVTNDEVQIESLQKLVEDHEWMLEQTVPGGIKVMRAKKPQEPLELEKIVRRLTESNAKRRADRSLKCAGLLVLTDGAKVPMLLTEEFIVEFKEDVTAEFIDELNAKHKVNVVSKSPFHENEFLLRTTAESKLSFLEAPITYFKTGRVELAHPNFVRPKVFRKTIPNDPLFGCQWHHENTGQAGGTPDADINTPLAWDITRGTQHRVIAVIDTGFEAAHLDLADNTWLNQGEIPAGFAARLTDIDADGLISFIDLNDRTNAPYVTDVNRNGRIDGGDLLNDLRWTNGVDDDGNGFPDDLIGWNFYDQNNDMTGMLHGTCVAGCIGARGGNNLGVSGTCPRCSMVSIKIGAHSSDRDDAHAFEYARVMGAEVINNSWGYDAGVPASSQVVRAINRAARHGRGGLGCIVLFAMPDENVDSCDGATPDISALASVIAVSSVSNVDRFDNTGFGNCMDVLGPTMNSDCGTGTLGITTTTMTCVGPYTSNFDGTSAATAITAGIASLVLDVAPYLRRRQMQRLFQDTTDKVEPTRGAYSPVTGFSSPASGVATHGYGRVNAFEAVRTVAPTACGGRAGVDIMLRDNRLDWGNTEQPSSVLFELAPGVTPAARGFIPYWESADIKVDAPPFQTAPTSSRQFDLFADEEPLANENNRVYVRVRNRGPIPAESVTVKLHWAFAGTALPALPADFWRTFPYDSSDTSQWHPLQRKIINDLEYCGTSVAGQEASDVAQIASFDFPAPALDPTQPAFQHYCLFCIVHSPQDSVSAATRGLFVPDSIAPCDNNVTLRNLVLQPKSRDGRSRVRFYARNPFPKPLKTKIAVTAPNGWKTCLGQVEFAESFTLKPGEERLLVLIVDAPDAKSAAEIVIKQCDLDTEQPSVLGGMTVRVEPRIPHESQPAGRR